MLKLEAVVVLLPQVVSVVKEVSQKQYVFTSKWKKKSYLCLLMEAAESVITVAGG